MAQFTNQAQLSYNNTIVNSNITVGEFVDALDVTKAPVGTSFSRDSEVTYIISITNTSANPFADLTLTDDLGAYTLGGAGTGSTTLYPLSYIDGSAVLYTNGVLGTAPTTVGGPPLTFTGINVPANGNVIIVYKADVTEFAPVTAASRITNTATLTGDGIIRAITAPADVTVELTPNLTITKSMNPTTVTNNSPLTYTLTIQNFGNAEVTAADNVTVTDTLDPALTGVNVTFNGGAWAEGVNYTYSEDTGVFTTVAGQITVPAATYTQDPTTGTWIVAPGTRVLTISGTV